MQLRKDAIVLIPRASTLVPYDGYSSHTSGFTSVALTYLDHDIWVNADSVIHFIDRQKGEKRLRYITGCE